MNQESQSEIVRQLFEACREQPQSIQRIRSLVLRHNNEDNNATEDEGQSLTTGSDLALEMRRREVQVRTRHPFSQARDENGLTPLSVACLYGASLEVIHFLATEQLLHRHSLQLDIDNRHIDDDDDDADADADDDDVSGNIDNCLQYACFAGASNDVISYLLQFDPKAVEMPDCTGQLALHAACCSPSNAVSLAVIHSLIRQYPRAVTMADNKGRTPLHHACSNPGISLPVVQCLVRHYAAAVQVKDENEMLPLHRACWYRAPLDVVDFLVDQYPQALQCPDQDGELPLHLVCLATTTMTAPTTSTSDMALLLELIPLLLKRHPQAKWQRNVSGYLPLELVSEKLPNAVQVLQLLTPSGWPPLHFACSQGCSMRTIRRLLELNPKEIPSSTLPSSCSLSPSSVSSSAVLLETTPRVADCEVADNHTTLLPLLFYACQGPRADLHLVRFLMEYNPHCILETSRQTGDTVLHHACRHGSPLYIVEFLVQCNPAAVTIKNHHGFVPLDLAVMIPVMDSDDDDTPQQLSSPPTLDVLYFLVRNNPNHILSYS